MSEKKCKITHCSEPRHAMGFCHLHYVRRMRATTANGGSQHRGAE